MLKWNLFSLVHSLFILCYNHPTNQVKADKYIEISQAFHS